MEINQLLESSNSYKSMQADSSRLADKWGKSGLLEGIESEKEKGNMAMILENQAKQIVAEANTTGTGGTFTAGDGEQWAGVALPLVRKVFAQIVAKDFVSVQPMNLPSGLVFYLDFKYGTATGGRSDGDNMYGNVSTANSKIAVDTDADGGLYGAGQFGYSSNQFTGTAAAATVAAATSASVDFQVGVNLAEHLTVNVALSSISGYDAEAVRSFDLTPASSGSAIKKYTRINGSNIQFVIASGSATAAIVNGKNAQILYSKQPGDNSRGDFEADSSAAVDTSITIPEVDVQLKSEAIVAKTRKLKAQWTPEFAQDLNAYHSVDAEAELTSLLSEYVSMEIDLEILDMLHLNALAKTERWSARVGYEYNSSTTLFAESSGTSNAYTKGDWFQTLGNKIQSVSNAIHQKTLRGGANFIVVSPEVATILESIPGYATASDGDVSANSYAMGVQKAGLLNNRYTVYKNPYQFENVILVGFRGSNFLETGAVYAPYVPLIMTPLVYDPTNFTPRKGVMTRYAKKIVRPEFYGKVIVADVNYV